MILHEAQLIAEYTGKGYWGTETLLERFAANRSAHPDREALVDPPNRDELVGTPARRLTWAELGRAVDAVAAGLASRGFGKDDVPQMDFKKWIKERAVKPPEAYIEKPVDRELFLGEISKALGQK